MNLQPSRLNTRSFNHRPTSASIMEGGFLLSKLPAICPVVTDVDAFVLHEVSGQSSERTVGAERRSSSIIS